jgi:hypothetical protein
MVDRAIQLCGGRAMLVFIGAMGRTVEGAVDQSYETARNLIYELR